MDIIKLENAFFGKRYAAIFLIIAIGTFLRIYKIDEESLWLDELYSIADAKTTTFQNFIPKILSGRHLYFSILRIWLLFDNSEAWLRLLSCIFGIIAIYLIYVLGLRFFNKKVGLIASMFMALSPLAINHSQEVRMYMLSTMLGLAGTIYLLSALNKYHKVDWLKYSVLRVLFLITTQVNFLILAPDITLIIIELQSKLKKLIENRKSRIYCLLGLFLILFIIGVLIIQRLGPVLFFMKTSNPESIGLSPLSFMGGITRFTVWPWVSYSENFLLAITSRTYGIISILLMVYAIFCKSEKYRTSPASIFALAIIPTLIFFIVCLILTPSHWATARYTVAFAPYIFVLLALGYVKLYRKSRTLFLLLFLLYSINTLFSINNYYDSNLREDWRATIQHISESESELDGIILSTGRMKAPFDYYYYGNNPIYALDNISDISSQSERNFSADYNRKFEEDLKNPDKTIASVLSNRIQSPEFRSLTSSHGNLWLVIPYIHVNVNHNQSEFESFKQYLSKDYDVQYFQFKEISLFCLTKI